MKEPFFILGCVRSGTGLLRNLLRLHPQLECPEETHFFRWGEPFGTESYNSIYRENRVLKRHREIDGILENEFEELFSDSGSRREINDRYGQFFLKKKKNPGGRFFDKTPQNVYGILLISAMYPGAQFVHIYRNPLNVVASLQLGKVMKVGTLTGCINYWMESMYIINTFKEAWPEKIFEVKYEDFLEKTEMYLNHILDFIGEPKNLIKIPPGLVYPEQNKYREVLSAEQKRKVIEVCAPFMKKYRYDEFLEGA